jgi:hypothetical protein
MIGIILIAVIVLTLMFGSCWLLERWVERQVDKDFYKRHPELT